MRLLKFPGGDGDCSQSPIPNPGQQGDQDAGKNASWALHLLRWVTLDKPFYFPKPRSLPYERAMPSTGQNDDYHVRMHSPLSPSAPQHWTSCPVASVVLTQGRGKRKLVTSSPFFTGTVTRLGSTRWAAMRSSSRLSDTSLERVGITSCGGVVLPPPGGLPLPPPRSRNYEQSSGVGPAWERAALTPPAWVGEGVVILTAFDHHIPILLYSSLL